MVSAKGPGTSSPAQECCRNFPKMHSHKTIYRAEALQPLSSMRSSALRGHSSSKGGQGQRERRQDPLEQGGGALQGLFSSPHLRVPIEKTAHQRSWTDTLGTSVCV